MPKALTLRLDETQAEKLEILAMARGNAVVDELRDAVCEHIDAWLKDAEVEEAVAQLQALKRKLGEALASRNEKAEPQSR